MVDVLMAMVALVADPKEHRDLGKFAQEALELVAQIRSEGLYDTEDAQPEEGPSRIEMHAREIRKKRLRHSGQLGSGDYSPWRPEAGTETEIEDIEGHVSHRREVIKEKLGHLS
jgi:hypothetical protein